MSHMELFFRSIAIAFFEAWTQRKTFLADAIFMILNNVIWIFFWQVFFDQSGAIRGWNTDHIFVLISMIAFVYGICMGFFGEVRRIGEMIAQRELDDLLTQPRHPLVCILPRRVNAVSVGDAVFGVVFFLWVTHPTLQSTLLFFSMGICGVFVFIAFLTIANSLTFFLHNEGEQGFFASEATMILTFYPTDVFGKFARVFLATVIPVSFVATIPARAVIGHSLADIAWLCGVAGVLSVIAICVFNAGMRRYRSGI